MPLITYDEASTMRQARARYFEVNDFGPGGGYEDAWVTFKLGPLPLSVPNTQSRRRAVAFHDLHHVLTNYDTDPIGEFEISAWEIGAGCKNYVAAWVLNLAGVAGGLFSAPRRTLRAFARGRSSQTLYGLELEPLLAERVGALREKTGLDRAAPESLSVAGWALFLLSAIAGLVMGTLVFIVGILASPILLLLSAWRSRCAARPQT